MNAGGAPLQAVRQRSYATEMPSLPVAIPREALTLGLLAGGRARRLGGRDKAWLSRDGVPQVLRWQARFGPLVAAVRVSANRRLADYRDAGIEAIPDATPDFGPVAGLAALADACTTPWLFTLPVDALDVPASVLPALSAQAGGEGAFLVDDEGPQPLVALWPVQRLRDASRAAIAADQPAVRALVARMGSHLVAIPGLRIGNLNTPADLAAAGVAAP